MRSLQSRLSAGLMVSLVALFAIQWWIVGTAIRSIAESYVASRLQHDGENLLAALLLDPAPALDPDRIDPIFKRPFSGHYYQIQAGETRLRSRSLWDQSLSLPPIGVGDQLRLHLGGPQEQRLLVWTGGFQKHDKTVTIAVAEELSAVESGIGRFRILYGLVSLGVVALLIFIQRRLVAAGLSPLERARGEILSLERGEIDHLREEVPSEVQPFIREINRLLDATRGRLQRSRNALGNMAHALKGPLTLLMQLGDRESVRADPAVRSELLTQTEMLRRLLERELKRARLAGSAQQGKPLALKEEIGHLVDALDKIYRDKSLRIEWSVPDGAVIPGEREDMLELLGNLLDNACKWGRTTVALRVEPGLDGLSISVEDDGPGSPPEALDRLSKRGVRVDESAAGHGLGLAIVSDILVQYGGKMEFGVSERLGGFQVRVLLPL